MIKHHPAKFGTHRHYVSIYIMFLVVEEQDSTCSHLNLPLVLVSWKYTTHDVNKYDIGHISLKQKKRKNPQTNFVSPPKNTDEKKKKNKKSVRT